MSASKKVVSAFETMKEFDVGETVEEMNAKIIKGLLTKPVEKPSECKMCGSNRCNMDHWPDRDWQDYLKDFMWTGQGWTCPDCYSEYMDLLDMS